VLMILVCAQVSSLLIAMAWSGSMTIWSTFDHVRYGVYSVVMLVIVAGAYFLDEQSRLQS
ncbi:unnamed protein product, partial [Polarella glacialis]